MHLKAARRRIDVRKEAAQSDRLRRGFERKLESRLKRLFTAQFNAASAGYEAGDVDAAMNTFAIQLYAVMEPHYLEVIGAFGKRVLDNLEIKFDFDNLSQRYLLERGSRNIRNIDEWTREKVSRILAKGQEDGLSRREIAKNIREVGQEFSKRRAATIARTETHNASSWANHEMHKEFMPPNTLKQWVSTNDPRTRSHHAAMNGIQVNINEDFEVPTDGKVFRMRYTGDYKGGPRNVINCRCTLIYISPDDQVIGDTEAEKPRYSDTAWVFKEGHKPVWDEEHHTFGLPRSFRADSFNKPSRLEGAVEFGKQYGLDFHEAALIYNYTTGSYRSINNGFRDWFKGSASVTDADKSAALGQRERIVEGFRKLPSYQGTVYRGVSNRVAQVMEEGGVKVGNIIRAESYWSTSYDKSVKFDKKLVYVIESKTGRKIDDMSEYPRETEVLFLPATEFEVIKIDERSKTYVYLREVTTDVKADLDEFATIVDDLESATEKVSRRFQLKLANQDDLISVNNMLIRI